ncbi:MAG: CAP domain-containing protein [Actinobacteria bacterium]|nr:CAP domain-containing protein [Actinomycetota bacterium]
MRLRFSCLILAAIAVGAMVFAGAAGARGIKKGPRTQQSLVFSAEEVAPVSVCPGQTQAGMSAGEQEAVMLCMTNFARASHGMAPLSWNGRLGRAAEQKSADILGCDEFSHEACGRPFQFWIQKFGYLKGCWRAAENIAWGTGSYATVGSIFTSWLESPEHHENILGPYREIGIGVRVGQVEGYEEAAVWTQDFGSHKC